MQKEFTKTVISIEPKTLRFGRAVLDKSQSFKKRQKIEISEGHNFKCRKNLGLVA